MSNQWKSLKNISCTTVVFQEAEKMKKFQVSLYVFTEPSTNDLTHLSETCKGCTTEWRCAINQYASTWTSEKNK